MTLSLAQAQADLAGLIHRLPAGEVVEIVENGQTVAKLTIEAPRTVPPGWRQSGLLKGAITIVEDDDEHLKDFAEYMP